MHDFETDGVTGNFTFDSGPLITLVRLVKTTIHVVYTSGHNM